MSTQDTRPGAWMEGQATFASPDADGTLQEVVLRTAEVIERQLALIAERASGEYLDKRPVVQSLQAHVRRLRAALAAPAVVQGGRDVVRRADIEAWAKLAGLDIYLLGLTESARERQLERLGSFAIFARAAMTGAECQTCNDNGMIGGPSFYAPDEGGDPCPDCTKPALTRYGYFGADGMREIADGEWVKLADISLRARDGLTDAMRDHLMAGVMALSEFQRDNPWIANTKRILAAPSLPAGDGLTIALDALKRLAEVPGCGCSFPCRCGGAEWTRIELEGRMDVAAEALREIKRLAAPRQPGEMGAGVQCVGCEGTPAPQNNPCAVCGKAASAQQDERHWQSHDDGLVSRIEPKAQQVQADAGMPTIAELTELLSGVYYMDPPDGGSVTLLEQLQRMSQDAARWRQQVQADAGAVAWLVSVPNEPELGHWFAEEPAGDGYDSQPLYLRPAAESDKRNDAAVADRVWSFIDYVAKPIHANGAILREQAQALLDSRAAMSREQSGGERG